LNALYDCINHVFWESRIDLPTKKSEIGALIDFINQRNYPENSIITADRGYESYNLIAHCIENNQKFVFRVKDISTRNGIMTSLSLPDETFDITDAIRDEILDDWKTSIQCVLENSLLVRNFKRSYDEYKLLIITIDKSWIMQGTQLFLNKNNIKAEKRTATCGLSLLEIFKEYVYKERNRCAHNTRSYQHNLPSIREMMSQGYKLQNYFLYMSIIILLDKIYIKLFEVYLSKLK